MFLGIRYNVWHGILAVIAVFLFFVVFEWLLGNLLLANWGPAITYLFLLVLSMLGAHHLQSWNESQQAIDPKVADKYGSYTRFQSDSRDDWKWFWRGLLTCWLLPIVYWIIVL